MCVNQDLLLREGIEIPKVGWTQKDLYEISKKLQKIPMEMESLINLG